MIDFILNLFRSLTANEKYLCSTECRYKKYSSSIHCCTKYSKKLLSSSSNKTVAHPIQNCGGIIETINELD